MFASGQFKLAPQLRGHESQLLIASTSSSFSPTRMFPKVRGSIKNHVLDNSSTGNGAVHTQ